MRELRWSRRSIDDLREIGRYISSDRPAAARKLLLRIQKKAGTLCALPFMGRIVPELNNEELREVIEKNYRIVYRVSEEFIEIVTVFEAHRMLPFEKDEEGGDE